MPRRSPLNENPRRSVPRWPIAAAVALAAVLPLTRTLSNVRVASSDGPAKHESRDLPPVDSRDKGSTMTIGKGTAPIVTETEQQLLDAAWAAVEEARARDRASTFAAPRPPLEQRNQEKLELLRQLPSTPTDVKGAYPDAGKED